MKLFKTIFAVLLLIAASASIVAADTVSDVRAYRPWDRYDQFTVSQFKRYGPANNAIDFRNIDYPLLNAAVFYETNRRRGQYGLGPYKHSDAMERAAFMHSMDMIRGNFFSHENYGDSRKRTPTDRTALFGGDGAGENIATTFGIQYEAGTSVSSISAIPPHTYNSFAEALVEGWMQSPGHKANILDEGGWGYEYLGCGAFYDANDEWHKFYATQNFSYSGKGAKSGGSGSSGGGTAASGNSGSTGRGGTSASGNSTSGERFTLERNNLLVNNGSGNWVQRSSSGGELYTYREDSRDGDFIYLYDQNRDLWLAIPVQGGRLYYRYGQYGDWQYWLITRKQ